ncbi:LysR family transcriptional regulator [Bacillus massiliigorillae]|uniref:LysR family transcriptional regulator n=1 Tax=Bacillus massiliigorillae TaxID=1243664 RepID=UPI0003A961DB|nr:LysR family transcriptional regulator [Bacillus massiliigorillae]
MEIHQLQYVIAVAKHNHFTKAAQEICVSQSTLSQQITKLENELGVKLFDRSTRYVQTTSAGNEFIMHAKQILSEIDKVKTKMLDFIGLTKGDIRIGAINSIGDSTIPSLITSFEKKYPGLNLLIIEEGSYRLLEMLENGDVDVAILTPPMEQDIHNVLEIDPLIEDEVVLIASSNHPLAKKTIIDLKEAENEKFIFPSRSHSAFNIAMHGCQSAGFNPKIYCESSHLYARFNLVSQEIGVALVSSKVAKVAKNDDSVIIHLKQSLKKPTVLAVLKNPHHPPPVGAFRDFAREWIATHSESFVSSE